MHKIKPRQKIRKGILIFSLLSFPIVLNFFSPVLSVMGAFKGLLSGAAITFIILFVSSLILGRAFCSWVCPGGALQSCAAHMSQPKKGPGGKTNWVKFFIWIPWFSLIIFFFIKAGGVNSVEPLWMTESGISVDQPARYIIYITVLLLILIPSLIWGRRTMCHAVCWMAPFMIIGRKIRNTLKWPALRLIAKKDNCISCKKCTQACAMSLPVQEMVQKGKPENSECILCLECVDTCQNKAINLTFRRG